jgi:sugar lactone lactonase YvrE
VPSPVITTLAGTGSAGYGGDGGPATSAMLYLPFGTAVDNNGNVFIADTYNSRIREVVKATGAITTVAGTGTPYYNGDGGPATSSNIGRPSGVAVDANGNLFIADTYNNRIREVVKSTGAMITIAGTGSTGYSGDGGPATSAMLNSPFGVAVDGSGNVLFADQGNNRVREIIKSTGTIVTVAGTGTASYNGDNRPATSAMLNQPNGVAVDASGDIFISDWHNNRIREVVKSTGNIITVAGTGTSGYNGDGGPATSAMVNYTGGVAVDGNGDLFIADSSNERVREVVNGIITTVAGTGTAGFGGDGGLATSALLNLPYAVAVDASGDLFIADSNNQRIREVLGAPSLGNLSSTAWTVNQPGFSGSVAIQGGTAPYSNLSATGLPLGLTAALSGSTITLSGTPTSVGTYSNVTLSIQDAGGITASAPSALRSTHRPRSARSRRPSGRRGCRDTPAPSRSAVAPVR